MAIRPMSTADFLVYLRGLDKSPNTLETYRFNLATFERWFTGQSGRDLRPELVTPIDVREYKRWLEEVERYAPGTVNAKLSALRGWLDWARLVGAIDDNPASRVRFVPAMPSISPKWLDRQQQYALIRTVTEAKQLAAAKSLAKSHRLAVRNIALLALMLHAGLRVSEAVNLRVDDLVIRPRTGVVTVRRGKGGKYRQVPLNQDARAAVGEWFELLQQAGQVGGHPLFAKNGKPLHVRTVQIWLSRLGRRAGLGHLTPHQLRHTFGKNLVDAGESLDRVARLMGHSSIDTTAIYTMPSAADLLRSVEKIAWG